MESEVKGTKRRGLLGLQIGLRQLLLATLCLGVWFAHWTNQDGIARLEPKLANLQTLSPELIVAEPKKIAVVHLPTPWYSTNRWEVFIPTDMVRICLATEDIAQEESQANTKVPYFQKANTTSNSRSDGRMAVIVS